MILWWKDFIVHNDLSPIFYDSNAMEYATSLWFSNQKRWLRTQSNSRHHPVAEQICDPTSLMNIFKKRMSLKKATPKLHT
jgi:hypothetical protein